MHDNKCSIWLEDAIAAGALLLLIYAAPPFVLSLERDEPQPQAQAASTPACDFTIKQYAAGQRWIPNQPAPACAVAARELPPNVLTHPLGD